MRFLALLLIVLIGALTPAAAAAQTASPQEIDEVRKNARVHAGPFYLTPSIQLKELGVDSNVFNAAGEQVSDFTANVSPRVDLWVPVARRALFSTSVATDLVWFREYSSERSIDPQVTARGELYFNRLAFFAEHAYLNTRQRPNFEIDLRSRHTRHASLAGFELRLTPKFSAALAGLRSDTQYEADAFFDGTSLQRTLNRTTTGGQGTLRHKLTPLTTIGLRAERLQDRFEFSPSRDADSWRVMPGVEFKPRALVKGTAYVGHRRFTPVTPGALPEFSGLVADLGLSYTLLGATTFGVSYRRDLTYSYEERQPFFISNSAGASVRRALGRRFDVLVSADRHTYDYQELADPLANTVPPVPRVDTTWNYAGSLGYRLGRDGRIGFGVSYWTRDSTTVRFRQYDNLRIGTTATYGF
jgi:hypothetical protein